MSREVRHDGARTLEIRFPFDRGLVDLIKTLPDRRWNAAGRFWTVPESDVVLLVDLLLPERFGFDGPTCDAYRGQGGTGAPQPLATPAPAPQPGLFDDPSADRAIPSTGSDSDDFTVSGLNQQVKQVLEAAFPAPVWLVGEISGFNRNAHKRHVGFQLVEQDDNGKTVSSIDATLFEQTRREVRRTLERAGEPFQLEDEVTVRLRVRVELYIPWGSYRVIVEELDVNYTLGEAARRREEIIRRLTEEGLVGRNTALPFPALPLRVGLITSLGSDAYNDVLRTLQESGLAFHVSVHGARVQGRSTEPSVLNALDRFRREAETLDVILICRGGGSRTDLAWFDSEALGRAVAGFPLPVVIGIGHEQDHSVLDAVGWRNKTPTAAASYLVETVVRSLERIDDLGLGAMEAAGRLLGDERVRGGERARRLAAAARGLLERERVELGHRRDRTWRAAKGRLTSAGEQLARWARGIPRASAVELARAASALDAARRAVAHGARRDVQAARGRADDIAAALAPRARRLLALEAERAESRRRRLHLIDPRRVVERGYAILRRADGPVVTEASRVEPGERLEAELKRGRLGLQVERTIPEGGD